MTTDRRELKIMRETAQTKYYRPNLFAPGKTRARFRVKSNSSRARLIAVATVICLAIITRIIRYNLSAYRALTERNQILANRYSTITSENQVSLEKNIPESKVALGKYRTPDELVSKKESMAQDTDVRKENLHTRTDSISDVVKIKMKTEKIRQEHGTTQASELEVYHEENDRQVKEQVKKNDNTELKEEYKISSSVSNQLMDKKISTQKSTNTDSTELKNAESMENLDDTGNQNQLRIDNKQNKYHSKYSSGEISTELKKKAPLRNYQTELTDNETVKQLSTSQVKQGENEMENESSEYNKIEYSQKSVNEVQDLETYLSFSNKTALNFMHFHKTGGVSFKTALFKFFSNKLKQNGDPVSVRDACYRRDTSVREGVPTFDIWRCDWKPLWELGEIERNKFDVVFGHQYRVGGAEKVLNQRDVKTFSVLRHPFDRKVSFFFHFFVRERGRDESKVQFEEIRDFLLFDKLQDSSLELGKDLGPNYMAGRILSDGKHGYVGNSHHKYYKVPTSLEKNLAENALKVIRKYIFVGLQSESAASMCMLRKTIENFNNIHGISNQGTEKVAATARVLNTGSYLMNSTQIWSRMTEEERNIFNKHEIVDIAIYEEADKLFRRQVKLFQCDSYLKGNMNV